VTDQNQDSPAQGSDANQAREHQNTNNNSQTMESLLNEQELNIDLPQVGEIRSGMIASVSPSQILVSIGAKSEGVISGRELDQFTSE
jgi:small subunit ribosomal protein S1